MIGRLDIDFKLKDIIVKTIIELLFLGHSTVEPFESLLTLHFKLESRLLIIVVRPLTTNPL